MKKIIFPAIVISLLTVSCNQKTKESTADHSNMMINDTTMMDKGGTTMSTDTTMMNDNNKMMNNQTKIYACPMHPEVQGQLNDKCSNCGMPLTEPVPEKAK